MCAAQEGNVAEVERYLKDGVRVDNKSVESQEVGWTALLAAARRGHADLVRLLLDHQADVNAKSSSLQTPLHGAAWNGHLAVVELLLERGADINSQSNSGQTALHGAAWNGHAAVAKLLIERGAAVNCRNKFGQTPLHWAAHYAHTSVADVLLQAGADLTLENEDGETPMTKAKSNPTKSAARSATIRLLQKSLTSKTFLAVLFSKKHDVKFMEWHKRMVTAIHNVQELKLYYTVLQFHLRQGMLTRQEANPLLESALERCAVVAAHTAGQMAQFKHVVAKCLQDNLINDDTYNMYDSHDDDMHTFATNMSASQATETMVRDMKTAIKRNSIRISGLDGSYRSLQQNFQIYCRKILMLQNDETMLTELQSATTSPASTDGNNKSATASGSTLHRYPSAMRAKKLKTKIEATLGLIGVLLNAIVMSYESNFLNKDFDHMCEGIVDFGDPVHIESCIKAETSNNDVESYFASYKSSFEMGVKLAAEILAPEKRQDAHNQHIDEALRARDPLFVLGLAATMATPSILENKASQEQEELARLMAKQDKLQEETATPQTQRNEQALSIVSESIVSGIGRQAMETMSAFVRPPLETSVSEPIFSSNGPERRMPSPSHASAAHLTAGYSLHSMQPNPSVSPYHQRPSMSALSSVTSSPQPSRTVTPALLSPFQARAFAPPATPTPADQSPVLNPFVASPTQHQRSLLYYDPGPSNARLLTPSSEQSMQHDHLQQMDALEAHSGLHLPDTTQQNTAPRTSPSREIQRLTLSPRPNHPNSLQEQGPIEIRQVPYHVRSEELSLSHSLASLQSTITEQFKDSILPIEDEAKLEMHAAVKYGDGDLLRDLVQDCSGRKSILNAIDSRGRTPADLAALTGQTDLMNFLVQESGGSFAFKSGARMRAIARRRAPFVNQYFEMVESDLEEA